MAKNKQDEAYRISADQLIQDSAHKAVIPCTLSADIGLGGGIPMGCTVLVGGMFKSGKTSTVLQYAANAQNTYGAKVFFFPIEGRLTQLVLQQIRGIKTDIDSFEVVMPPPIRKDDMIVGYQKWSSERWWEEIGKTVTNNPGSVIIVDSIANMGSEKESSEGMGYQDRGGKQKLEAQFCRSYGDLIGPSGITLFLLTQIQANTSGYGPMKGMKVGNHIRHQADTILFFKRVDKWEPTDGRILGHNIECTIECSALGPPFIDISIPLRYGYGIDNVQDVITHGANWGIIEQAGAGWFKLPFVEKEDGEHEYVDVNGEQKDKCVRIQGKANVRNWMVKHPQECNKIEETIRNKVLV